MSVCTSHPQTADPFIRDPAVQGRPPQAPAFFPPSERLMVSERFLSQTGHTVCNYVHIEDKRVKNCPTLLLFF